MVLGSRRVGVVEQHTQSRRFSIFKLAVLLRPEECREKSAAQNQAENQQDKQRFHQASPLRRAETRAVIKVNAMTLNELIGMSMAQKSGVRPPVSATLTPKML